MSENNLIESNTTATEDKKDKIFFAKTNRFEGERAIIPTKKSEDAGYDIYACFDAHSMRIPAHKTVLIPTGIATALPEGYYFQIEERSSVGGKLGLKKNAGVMDSGYRGEWYVAIYNTNDRDVYIVKKEYMQELMDAAKILDIEILTYPYEKAIAEAVLHRVYDVDEEEITYEELKNIKSERGTEGFGSTGK